MNIPLIFLGDGKYVAEIYSDADDTNENPNHVRVQNQSVTKQNNLSLKLAAGGGLVIHLKGE